MCSWGAEDRDPAVPGSPPQFSLARALGLWYIGKSGVYFDESGQIVCPLFYLTKTQCHCDG